MPPFGMSIERYIDSHIEDVPEYEEENEEEVDDRIEIRILLQENDLLTGETVVAPHKTIYVDRNADEQTFHKAVDLAMSDVRDRWIRLRTPDED